MDLAASGVFPIYGASDTFAARPNPAEEGGSLNSTTLELQLELLTPAFVGSATTRQVDPYMHVRASAVRGLLRVWFRMAAAALLWPRSDSSEAKRLMVNALRQVEGRFFGQAVDDGDGSHRSWFSVLPSMGGQILKYRDEGVPDQKLKPGLRYLGYGLFDDRSRAPEALVTRDGPLTLTLRLRAESVQDEKDLEALLGATLWLWLHLGGLGARSRRGFGSMKLCGSSGVSWPTQPLCLNPPRTRQELLDRLIGGVDAALDVFRSILPRCTEHPLEQSGATPHRAIRSLFGLQTAKALPVFFTSPEEAMEETGRLMRDFRGTLRRNALGLAPLPDYFGVKQALQGHLKTLPRTVERAAFGLPLPFYFRSLNGAKCTLRPKDKKHDRLPSPLHLRVHALAPGCGFAMVMLNMSEGMDVLLGETLTIDGAAISSPDGKILDQFIDWASNEAARSPLGRRPPPGQVRPVSGQGGRR